MANAISVDCWWGPASSAGPTDVEFCCEACVTPAELRGAARYRRATSRNQHIIGRGMARAILAMNATSAHPVSPQHVEFEFNSHGKPVIRGPEQARCAFNIAHTEGMVVVARSASGALGVDVEGLSRRTDIAIADRYFARSEVEFVMAQVDEDRRRRAFLKVWTLKESFIKAIGTGLSIPLADFAFEQIESDRPRVRLLTAALGNADHWRFASFTPRAGYIAAVAISDVPPGVGIDVRAHAFEPMLPEVRSHLTRAAEGTFPPHDGADKLPDPLDRLTC